jgi:flagellar assembly protein FliH
LHPDDASLIREVYSMSDQEQGWVINEDPLISRGGCRVVTETSRVDATLESRLANIIAPLLGGERDADDDGQGESP